MEGRERGNEFGWRSLMQNLPKLARHLVVCSVICYLTLTTGNITHLKGASKQLQSVKNLLQFAITMCEPAHRHLSPSTQTHTRASRRASTSSQNGGETYIRYHGGCKRFGGSAKPPKKKLARNSEKKGRKNCVHCDVLGRRLKRLPPISTRSNDHLDDAFFHGSVVGRTRFNPHNKLGFPA